MASSEHDSSRPGQPPDLRLVIDSTPALIHTGRPDGYLDFFNKTWLRYVGLSMEDLEGWKWTAAIHPEDVEGIVNKWRASIASGESLLHEARVRRADGEYRWMLHHKVAIRDAQGNVVKWYGTSVDIEDRRRSEDSLRRSEAYLAAAQRLSHTGSFGWTVSSGELFWSEETFRIFEYDRTIKPTVGLVLQRVHPEDAAFVKEIIERASEDAKEFDFEHRLLMLDGSIKHLHVVAHALRHGSGEIAYVGAVMEITAAKQVEEKIRKSEAELRTIIETIPAHIGTNLPDGTVDFISQSWLDYLGISKEQWLGLGWMSVTHPEDVEQARARSMAAFLSGQPVEIEQRFRRADGTYRWFLGRNVPLRDEKGNIVKWYGTLLDVDDRKRAEAKIRQSEAELRQLIDVIPQQVMVFDPDWHPLFANQQDLRHTGLTLEEAQSKDAFARIVHPEDLWKLEAGRRRGRSELAPFEVEVRVRGKDGQYRWFLIRDNPLLDEEGRVLRWYGTRTDIDDRKRAEEALRVSEEQWRNVFENNPTMYFMVDPAGTVLAVNPYGAEQLGYAVEELVSRPVLQVFYGSDREAAQRHVVQCMSQPGQSLSWELRKVRKDGSMLWVRETARAVIRGNNPVVLIACEDITARRDAEDKIREKEIELRQVVNLAPQLIFVEDADGNSLYSNQAALDYYGFTFEQWQKSDRSKVFYPGDWDRILHEVREKFLSGLPHEAEGRLRRKDGKYRWFLLRRNPLRDDKGRVVRWYVAATDIEDRKQAEERVQEENVALREEIDKQSMFEEIVGTSAALRSVLSRVSKVAPSDSTVLITGETGTGKELVARAIHKLSRRSARPFVSVNCAAVPRELIASELFGHEMGSFTGALQRRLGRFELAEGGTIFLDEVGELPAESQIALLRVLQEREFERVGGSQPIRADVRIIAATNRDLDAAIAAGVFRSDLFYRLNVFPMVVPPLRERRADIPILVEYFIARYSRKAGKKIRTVEKTTMQLLRSYSWPGNIRELQNVIERSLIVCETDTFSVDPSWLSLQPAPTGPGRLPLVKRPRAQEKEIIEGALAKTGGKVSGPLGAAALLGIPASTLESKIRSLKINKFRYKSA
jgi:formate hydrogenlyase transcriptional activator